MEGSIGNLPGISEVSKNTPSEPSQPIFTVYTQTSKEMQVTCSVSGTKPISVYSFKVTTTHLNILKCWVDAQELL